MQKLPGQRPQRLLNRPTIFAIRRVTRDRMADCRHMNPNLVSSPGLEQNVDERVAMILPEHLETGGRTATAGDDGHALPVFGVTAHGLVDPANHGRTSPH